MAIGSNEIRNGLFGIRRLDPALLHLGVVYLVWGSTYLVVKIALSHGMSPIGLGAVRYVASGALLLAASKRVMPRRHELPHLLGAGVLMWALASGLMMFAVTRLDSGFAALMMACTPMWVGAVEALIDRRRPPAALVVCWLVGALGIGLLSAPKLQIDALALGALICASICWAGSVVWQKRRPVALPAAASAGWQLGAAGMCFSLVWLALQASAGAPSFGPSFGPSFEAWWAIGYLVIIGSLAFTSFRIAVERLPSHKVMTYAYVNPVVAVALGWIVLDEALSWSDMLGALLVLLAIAGVFKSRVRQTRAAPPR